MGYHGSFKPVQVIHNSGMILSVRPIRLLLLPDPMREENHVCFENMSSGICTAIYTLPMIEPGSKVQVTSPRATLPNPEARALEIFLGLMRLVQEKKRII